MIDSEQLQVQLFSNARNKLGLLKKSFESMQNLCFCVVEESVAVFLKAFPSLQIKLGAY